MYTKRLMVSLIVLLLGVLLALPMGNAAEYYTVNYTETYNTVEYVMSEDILYINIPQGNYIDFIEFRPKFLPSIYQPRYINTTLYYQDEKYEILNTITTEPALLNLFSDSLTWKLELEVDESQEYLKEYENKVFTSCWFNTYQKMSFANSIDLQANQIELDTHIISNKGKILYNDVISVYQTDSYICGNITIDKDNLNDLTLHIGYRQENIKSEEYYISMLSPTLQIAYSTALQWIDTEHHILNLLLVTDYIIGIISFSVIVIAQNLGILTVIILCFIVPFTAYYNSNTQKGFIDNMTLYYGKIVEQMLNFVKYMVDLIVKFLEIVRSMIPFI